MWNGILTVLARPLAHRSATDPGPHPALATQAHGAANFGEAYKQTTDAAQRFWNRLQGKGRRSIGWGESAKNILSSSCESRSPAFGVGRGVLKVGLRLLGLNVLLLIIPIAWVSHWMHWGPKTTFICEFPCFIASLACPERYQVNFFAIMPLDGLLDWGGEQMAMYLGKNIGDLLIITLHK